LLATVRADQPENAVVRGDQYAFLDDGGSAGLTPGLRYSYRMQAVNRRGVVGAQSAEISVDFALPPPPPVGLVAVAGDGVVNLTWQPPAGQAGAAPRGYNIYRGVQPGVYGSGPVNAGPIVETQFRDAPLRNETTYYYVVRSVGGERPPWRESRNSAEISARPVDLTPPAPPQGLTAIPAPGVVSLTWTANTEPDLLGYVLYRREPPALNPVRLTEAPVQTTTFTDRAARAGVTYVYTVTAVDRSSHRNESAPSSEVSVTVP
jgi:cell division septation protein DedD